MFINNNNIKMIPSIRIQRWWRSTYQQFTQQRWKQRIEIVKSMTGNLNRTVEPAPPRLIRYSSSGYEHWCCPYKHDELVHTPGLEPLIKLISQRLVAYGFHDRSISEAKRELNEIRAAVKIQRWVKNIK